MWCKFGHVPLTMKGNETLVLHRVDMVYCQEHVPPAVWMHRLEFLLANEEGKT